MPTVVVKVGTENRIKKKPATRFLSPSAFTISLFALGFILAWDNQLRPLNGLIRKKRKVFKVIPWFCTAHRLLRITRWPP